MDTKENIETDRDTLIHLRRISRTDDWEERQNEMDSEIVNREGEGRGNLEGEEGRVVLRGDGKEILQDDVLGDVVGLEGGLEGRVVGEESLERDEDVLRGVAEEILEEDVLGVEEGEENLLKGGEVRGDSVSLLVSSVPQYDSVDLFGQTIISDVMMVSPAFENKNRSAVDLVAVVDVSGSMGEHLYLVKHTLSFMVTQLTERDRFCLVTFSGNTTIQWQLEYMGLEQKALVNDVIKSLCAGGGTCLSGGIFTGLDVVKDMKNEGKVTSVLLFTDGEATSGIIGTNLIDAVVKVEIPIEYSLYTFGFGRSHNSELLQQLAANKNGVYYFISNGEQIAEAFSDCLGGLLSVTAQNIKMVISPVNGSTIEEIKTNFKYSPLDKNSFLINIGDIQSEEERDILVSVSLPESHSESQFEYMHTKINYFNVITCEPHEVNHVSTITRSKEPQKKENIHVNKQMNRVTVANAIQYATDLNTSGSRLESTDHLRSTIGSLKSSISYETDFVQELENDINQCIREIENNRSTFLTKSISLMHSRQRNASSFSSSYTTLKRSRTKFESSEYFTNITEEPSCISSQKRSPLLRRKFPSIHTSRNELRFMKSRSEDSY
eukprot:TRINITY_DN11853_c0_g1_i1.p1 TRINITY_DN11853_c0_g1~~TRINITY_DN11853_c0_g1_i1.p1  ORF type:complete len:607 (+),score=141.90 TRINITY_DN11853_c0_g1_i1:33-1853(+)